MLTRRVRIKVLLFVGLKREMHQNLKKLKTNRNQMVIHCIPKMNTIVKRKTAIVVEGVRGRRRIGLVDLSLTKPR